MHLRKPYPHYVSALNELIGRTTIPFTVKEVQPDTRIARLIRERIGERAVSMELDNDLERWVTRSDGDMRAGRQTEIYEVGTGWEFLGYVVVHTLNHGHVRSWAIPSVLES
jgi:hypothetical protein